MKRHRPHILLHRIALFLRLLQKRLRLRRILALGRHVQRKVRLPIHNTMLGRLQIHALWRARQQAQEQQQRARLRRVKGLLLLLVGAPKGIRPNQRPHVVVIEKGQPRRVGNQRVEVAQRDELRRGRRGRAADEGNVVAQKGEAVEQAAAVVVDDLAAELARDHGVVVFQGRGAWGEDF